MGFSLSERLSGEFSGRIGMEFGGGEEASRNGVLKVALVDDDGPLREMNEELIGMCFPQFASEILSFDTGDAAVGELDKLLEEGSPLLLLTDNRFSSPQGLITDGDELARHVRQTAREVDVPVYIVNISGTRPHNGNFDDSLLKPYAFEDLHERIQKGLDAFMNLKSNLPGEKH